MADEVSIKISLTAYQELTLRKFDTGVPITKQIDRLLLLPQGTGYGKTSKNPNDLQKRNGKR